MQRIATGAAVKVSLWDVAALAARGGDGATTVASTAHLGAATRITVFATGGLGGVHRGARDSWDESADLTTLSRTGVLAASYDALGNDLHAAINTHSQLIRGQAGDAERGRPEKRRDSTEETRQQGISARCGEFA